MSRAPDLDALSWPADRLGELLEALAAASGLAAELPELPPPAELPPPEMGRWIERAAPFLGLDAEAVATRYRDLESFVRRAAPAVIRVPLPEGDSDTPPRFLALLPGRGGRRARLLSPRRETAAVPVAALRDLLARRLETSRGATVDRLLERAGTPGKRRQRARKVLLERTLGALPIGGCWLLRASPEASFPRQLRRAGVGRRLAGLLAAHALQYGLWLGSWFLIGRGALAGRLDPGWLTAWALLLATLVPVQLLGYWLQGRLVIDASLLLKRRLLQGALRVPLDDIRRRGSGELLGRVIESETFEALVLSGGFLALTATVEVVMVLPVLAAGAGGLPNSLVALAAALAGIALGARYHRLLGRWTGARLSLTLDLVERMVGYRTRLAQQAPERWHDGEDRDLESYHTAAKPMDTTAATLAAGLPRAALVLGILTLGPAFLLGDPSTAALALALGGNLLAFSAVARLGAGATALAAAHVAWRQIAPLFHAAEDAGQRGDPVSSLAAVAPPAATETDEALLAAENLTFRYHPREPRVLRGAALTLRRGDRVLLEGSSGGGKSTLLSLLTGLRDPGSGLLLLGGLDRRTLGDDAWRSRLATAPQFHDNHVLLGTFAFNLLMGRRWPPTAADLREAEALCRELGLGELLERMPAGLHQMVGDTGWQLSGGERSRLYLARALLQDADIVVLDESFAALDPESLRQALATTLERAPTLLVVAHP